MKCPECHSENPSDSKFCKECGTQLIPIEEPQVSHTKTLETPKEELTSGSTFAGRYQIIEELGKGGMGKVYRAIDKKLNEEVALKLIKPEIASDKKTLERFSNELKIARRIVHKNVGRMYELMEEKGTHYITMEYVPGEDLKSFIRRSRLLAIGTAITVAKQVCDGLTEAHILGVVHRDLKPSNIMIDKEGNARIMDFGIARSLREKGITGEGVMIGTPEYMSPEQVEGKEADQRSDIYSLGIVLYKMVTGSVPFEGDTPFTIGVKHKSETPKDPRELNAHIPEDLSHLILKCLEKDKEKRYQSAGEMRSELEKIEEGIPTTERVVSKRKPITAKEITVTFGLRKLFIPALIFLALIIAAIVILVIPSARLAVENWLGIEIIPTEKRLAILPFTLVSGDSSDQVFCYGLVESMTNKLSRLEQFHKSLWVLPAYEVYEYEITSPSRARRVFRINLAAMGTFKRLGDMFTLTLRLVNTEDLDQVKSQSITDHIANISTLQEDVVVKLLEMLEIKLRPQMSSVLTTGRTTVPGAYEYYVRGLGHTPLRKKEGDLDKAISLFEQAIEKDPHYALAYAGLGKAYWEKYKLTRDSVWIEKAQSSCKSAIEMCNRLALAYVILGITYGKTGRSEDAIREFQHALQIDPEDFKALRELAEIYENIGRMEEAEKTYKKYIGLKPSYWVGYSLLGYIYYRQGRYEEAEKMYRKSTKLMMENVNDYNCLMAIYYWLGKFELAENAFEKSIAIKPDEYTYSNMGSLYIYQSRYADALAMYEKAIELGGKSFRIWANLADSYRYTPGYEERAPEAYQRAIELAKEELKIDPGNIHYRSSLAVIYARVGNYKNALAEISKARSQAPKDVPILFNCILLFELINQREKALQAFQEYVEFGGSLEEIRDHPDLSGFRTDPRYQQLVKR